MDAKEGVGFVPAIQLSSEVDCHMIMIFTYLIIFLATT